MIQRRDIEIAPIAAKYGETKRRRRRSFLVNVINGNNERDDDDDLIRVTYEMRSLCHFERRRRDRQIYVTTVQGSAKEWSLGCVKLAPGRGNHAT